jgi:hypothetical protein
VQRSGSRAGWSGRRRSSRSFPALGDPALKITDRGLSTSTAPSSCRSRCEPALRVLVCPDKFRGTLSAAEARLQCRRRTLRGSPRRRAAARRRWGGTLAVLLEARGGDVHEARYDHDGSAIVARFGLTLPDGVAVVEMAQASGAALSPARTTRYGHDVRHRPAHRGGGAGRHGGDCRRRRLGDSRRRAKYSRRWAGGRQASPSLSHATYHRLPRAARVFARRRAGPEEIAQLTDRLGRLAESCRAHRLSMSATSRGGCGRWP